MKQYDFTVLRQKIDSPENVGFVSGSAEIYEAVFCFDETWEGFSCTAVFECAGQGREQLLVNDRCIIPWEILHAGAYLRIGIYGVKDSMRMPTVYSAPMFVMRGAEPSEAAREHSADMFDQIVEIGQQAAEAKEDVDSFLETLEGGSVGQVWTRTSDDAAWADPQGGGGASSWNTLADKPFERIGDTLAVQDGTLDVNIHETINDAGGITTIIG